jgi:hypothetical protein
LGHLAAAAALSVTQLGAQRSAPNRKDIELFLTMANKMTPFVAPDRALATDIAPLVKAVSSQQTNTTNKHNKYANTNTTNKHETTTAKMQLGRKRPGCSVGAVDLLSFGRCQYNGHHRL